jgi:uncharacterized RDD family membrane protein YckC
MEQQDHSDFFNDVKVKEEPHYVDPVHWTVRLTNYFTDQFVLTFIFNIIKYAIAYSALGKNYEKHILYQQDVPGLIAMFKLAFVVIFIYYLLFEGLTKGRTIGKLATRTIAITQNGTPFTFKDAFLRTLCRFIPFEIISGFLYMPWHDSLTKTVVVRKTW